MTIKNKFQEKNANQCTLGGLLNHDLFEANGNQYLVVEDHPTYYDLNYSFCLRLDQDPENRALVLLKKDVKVTLIKRNATLVVE